MAENGVKISEFTTSPDIADTDLIPMVRPVGGGAYEDYKVPYSVLVPGGSSPDLQSVTDVGATTTNGIIVSNDAPKTILVRTESDTDISTEISATGIRFSQSGGIYQNLKTNPAASGDPDILLPANAGTLALEGGITLQDVTTAGNTTTDNLNLRASGVETRYCPDKIEIYSSFLEHTRTLYYGTPSSDQSYFLPEQGGVLATNLQQAVEGGAESNTAITIGITGTGDKTVVGIGTVSIQNAAGENKVVLLNDGGAGRLCLYAGDPTYFVNIFANAVTGMREVFVQDANGTMALEETMTLDKVLTAGKLTENNARFNNTGNNSYITINDDVFKSGVYVRYNAGPQPSFQVDYGGFVYGLNNDVDYLIVSPPVSMSGSNQVRFPNASGTILVGTKGTATLVSGTITISDANVKSTSVVTAIYRTPAGTIGVALKAIVSAGSGFTITAITSALTTQTLDTSTVQYTIVY